MMRDFSELITRLKQSDDNCNAECCECSGECLSSGCNIFSEASDAIEELLDELTTIRKQLPHWISVEERLPKKKVGCKGYVGYLVLSDGEYQIADFAHDKYMQTAYEFHVDGKYDPNITHWMELPPKEVE